VWVRKPRAAPWNIEDALKVAVEKMEKEEREESARKKRRLTLEMQRELEESAAVLREMERTLAAGAAADGPPSGDTWNF
jgi:hypothetical protein